MRVINIVKFNQGNYRTLLSCFTVILFGYILHVWI